MLDKKTAVVLAYLNGECNGGAYKVIEKEDILSSLPKKYAFDKEMLVETLDYLCERSYISIKHKDENMICVGVLPKGRLFAEEKAKEILSESEIEVLITLGNGDGKAVAWGCDLTYDYVKINGDYRT